MSDGDGGDGGGSDGTESAPAIPEPAGAFVVPRTEEPPVVFGTGFTGQVRLGGGPGSADAPDAAEGSAGRPG